MNWPDKEKIVKWIGSSYEVENHIARLVLERYESKIKPQVKSLESELTSVKAENERLREALLHFATIGEAIANHRKNMLPIKDSHLVNAYNVYKALVNKPESGNEVLR